MLLKRQLERQERVKMVPGSSSLRQLELCSKEMGQEAICKQTLLCEPQMRTGLVQHAADCRLFFVPNRLLGWEFFDSCVFRVSAKHLYQYACHA